VNRHQSTKKRGKTGAESTKNRTPKKREPSAKSNRKRRGRSSAKPNKGGKNHKGRVLVVILKLGLLRRRARESLMGGEEGVTRQKMSNGRFKKGRKGLRREDRHRGDAARELERKRAKENISSHLKRTEIKKHRGCKPGWGKKGIRKGY